MIAHNHVHQNVVVIVARAVRPQLCTNTITRLHLLISSPHTCTGGWGGQEELCGWERHIARTWDQVLHLTACTAWYVCEAMCVGMWRWYIECGVRQGHMDSDDKLGLEFIGWINRMHNKHWPADVTLQKMCGEYQSAHGDME